MGNQDSFWSQCNSMGARMALTFFARLTTELSDAGGPTRPHWQLTWPARVRSSDFVRRSNSLIQSVKRHRLVLTVIVHQTTLRNVYGLFSGLTVSPYHPRRKRCDLIPPH